MSRCTDMLPYCKLLLLGEHGRGPGSESVEQGWQRLPSAHRAGVRIHLISIFSGFVVQLFFCCIFAFHFICRFFWFYIEVFRFIKSFWTIYNQNKWVFGRIRAAVRNPSSVVSDPKLSFWRNFYMILHGFAWRSPKNTVTLLRPRNIKHDQKQM